MQLTGSGGWRVLELDAANPCFTVTRTATSVGRKVAAHLAVERRCTTLPVADYPGFREAVQKVVKQFQD